MKGHIQTIVFFTSLWIVLSIATALGLFERIESKIIDQAMRLRPKQPVAERIMTIDIDDPSISDVGRWPWRWGTHRMMLDFLQRHQVGFVFFMDIDLSKKPPLWIPPEEEEVINKALLLGDSKRVRERLRQNSPEGFISQTYLMRGKVYFTANSKIDESPIKTSHPSEGVNTDRYKQPPDITTSLRGDSSFLPIKGQSFLSASLLNPPIKELIDNSEGVGVNAYMPDVDGVVRRYPLFIDYREKLYPSIALKAAMAMLQAEKGVIKKGSVEIKLKERLLTIPIDRYGQMRVNWTGRYGASFVHVPFNLLTPFMVVQSLKDTLRGIDIRKMQDPMALHGMLIEHAYALGLMKKEDASNRATILFLSLLMEHYFNEAGYGVEETLEALGLEGNNRDFMRVANQVYLNNNVLAIYNRDRRISPFEEAVKLIEAPSEEINTLRDSYEQLVSYITQNTDTLSIRPLYFEPSKVLRSDLGEKAINPWVFKDKSVFYGLTATGLTSQNPSPHMDRHPMLDLAPQAVNTLLTGKFIKDTPLYAAIGLILLCLMAVFFSVLKTKPIKGLFIILMITLIYLLTAWIFLLEVGLILPITPALATISSSYLLSLFIGYCKEYNERRRVRKIFSTMVSPEVLKIMEGKHNAITLTGEIREATVFSSDVSGFTNISEGVTAQELAQILNLYLTAMSNIIMSYDGYIDKYEGDAIKAVFGMPLHDEGHPWKACWAALAQQEELKIIQRMILLRYGVVITARMGINTGTLYAGNMGSEKRLQYTVMGETVRIAEELEPANKLFNTWIAAGDETVKKAQGYIQSRHLGNFESSEGTIISANEVIAWDRGQFIRYWKDKPVPELILDSIKRLSPLRALAWLDYCLEKAERIDNPMFRYILTRLQDVKPLAMEYMKMQTLLLFRGMHKKISTLQSLYSPPLQGPTAQYPESSEEAENRLLKVNIALDRLEESIKQQSLDSVTLEEALLEVDTLRKTLESFRKRIPIEAVSDSIAGQLRDYIIQVIVDKGILILEGDHHNLQTMSEIESSIKNQGAQIAKYIKERPEEFYSLSALLITL